METNPSIVVGILAGLTIAVLFVIYLMSSPHSSTVAAGCPKEIHRMSDGSLVLHPGDKTFEDMNDFQQWWNSSGLNRHCPLPRLTGARGVPVLVNPDRPMGGPEVMYATTPINKVDDYEFSRIFGVERGNEMVIPRQNFNKIVSDRAFDDVNKPVTAEGRKDSYRGVVEGFTATGELTSNEADRYGSSASEAAARYNEVTLDEPDKDCKISREEKKIAKLVAKAYENDPNFDPVVVKVGENQWEVNELIPKRRGDGQEVIVEEEILDPKRETVDIKFRYPGEHGKGMIDPFFPPSRPGSEGHWGRHKDDDHNKRHEKDPYHGYVPGLERPFGPTFDHFSWT